MNIEFHYYVNKILALEAGFDEEEAEIIAYSSQLVDDNRIQFKIEVDEDEIYENFITQTADITKPKKELMRIYLLYHFIPGDPTSYKAKRRDGKMHLLMTTPGSTNSMLALEEGLNKENLYMIGIASHAFADSFSHQNFVGTFDEINAMEGIWTQLMPNIGHADAGHKPDIANLIWDDTRMIGELQEVDNTARFILAAQKLYRSYILVTASTNRWTRVRDKLQKILGEGRRNITPAEQEKEQKVRIEKYLQWLEKFDADDEYDKNKWFKKAVDYDVKLLDNRKFPFDPVPDVLKAKKGFENSNWYNFQEAVKFYQKLSTNLLNPILSQVEIPEW